jgi:hypothetical protein
MNRPVQDLFEMIAFPRGEETGGQMLRRPFAVRVPPGDYVLRVDVSDVNGRARGSFVQSFTVGGRDSRVPESASAP